MHELDDKWLVDVLPVAKKVAKALGCKEWNVLQNNGALAHQVVKHVHFHVVSDESRGGGAEEGNHWQGGSSG